MHLVQPSVNSPPLWSLSTKTVLDSGSHRSTAACLAGFTPSWQSSVPHLPEEEEAWENPKVQSMKLQKSPTRQRTVWRHHGVAQAAGFWKPPPKKMTTTQQSTFEEATEQSRVWTHHWFQVRQGSQELVLVCPGAKWLQGRVPGRRAEVEAAERTRDSRWIFLCGWVAVWQAGLPEGRRKRGNSPDPPFDTGA